MAMYTWECDSCGSEVEVVRPISEYQAAPTLEEVLHLEEDVCAPSQHVWRKTIKGVNFSSSKRHVGANEFAKDRTRQELIEANRIEREMFNLPQDKRDEHKKAIKKLKSTDGGN